MPDYLLMENGDRFLTEDGNDLLVLEVSEPATGFTARRYHMWHRIYTNGIAFILWLTT